jgi:DNA (cytosine-5)-methyltransferase 1
VENVPALLTGKGKRWDRAPVGRVLGDLAEAGYDAEWACLSAREFGAPHLRKRVWLVAYPARDAEARPAAPAGSQRQRARQGCPEGRARELPDADRDGCPQGLRLSAGAEQPAGSADALGSGAVAAVADTEGEPERAGLRPSQTPRKRRRRSGDRGGSRGAVADPERGGRPGGKDQLRRGDLERKAPVGSQGTEDLARGGEASGLGHRLPASESWCAEPDVGRVADGVPARVDRLAALGNALLPQIAEWIGRRILACEASAHSPSLPAREGALS